MIVSSFSLFYHFHTQGLILFCWVSPVMEVDVMGGVGYVDVVFVERNGSRETWIAKCPFCKQYATIVRERRIVKDGCVDVEWRVEEACIHFCNLFPLAYTAMFSSFSEGR